VNSCDSFGKSRLSRQALAATWPQQMQPAAPEVSTCPRILWKAARASSLRNRCHADGSLCELGRKAMDIIYRATDTSLQRKVALKLIKTEVADRSVARLEERVHRAGLLHFCAAIDKSTDSRSREVFELTNFVLAI